MSDIQRPSIVTLLAILAIITGVFSIIRSGLLIFQGINLQIEGVSGVFVLIIGILSLAVGVLALVSGIRVMWDNTGGMALMQKYAIALIGYNIIWIIYSSVAGGKISWLSLISELAIGIITIGLIKTSEDIKAYLESLAQQH
jgi:hypothetical protein